MALRFNPVDLFRGFAYPLRGLAFIRRNTDLARYWLPPIAIMFVALVLGAYLSIRYHDDLLALLWTAPQGEGVATGFMKALYVLVEVLVFVISLGSSILLCAALSTIFAAPFNDALSEAVEKRAAGIDPPPFSVERLLADLVRTVRIEVLKLAAYISVMFPLWVLSFLVPGVGHVLYVVFGALFTTSYFALDYIDWPASRRRRGIRARLAVLGARPMLMLGFGACVWGLLFVPFLNLLLMPAAVVGGTHLFLDLESATDHG